MKRINKGLLITLIIMLSYNITLAAGGAQMAKGGGTFVGIIMVIVAFIIFGIFVLGTLGGILGLILSLFVGAANIKDKDTRTSILSSTGSLLFMTICFGFIASIIYKYVISGFF